MTRHMPKVARLMVLAAFATPIWIAPSVRAQGDSTPESSLAPRVRDLTSRLEALSPTNPRAYLELGEEVAAEAGSLGERLVAQHLIVLAFELERERGDDADRTLLASCCLALTRVADSDGDRRWLRAVAELVAGSGRSARPADANAPVDPPPSESSALDAANVFAFIRTGRGSRAEKLLQRAGVQHTLQSYERLLSPGLMTGGFEEVRTLARDYATCPTCHLRRYIKDGSGIRLCPQCAGRPGPKLSDAQLVLQLRTEAAILNGVQRSWAASTMVDAGAPVRDADPAELAATFSVDPAFAIYRNGKWVKVSGKADGTSTQLPAGAPQGERSAGKPTSPAASTPAPSRVNP